MAEARIRIGVIGSGKDPLTHLSEPLGRWIAMNGFDLVNGGGQGVMAATAFAFRQVEDRRGLSIGILPAQNFCDHGDARAGYQTPHGYPNDHIDLPIRTHLPLSGSLGKDTASRNHIIVLTADCLVALPGTEGTRTEIELALDYGKPLTAVSPEGEWDRYASRAKVVPNLEDALEWVGQTVAGF